MTLVKDGTIQIVLVSKNQKPKLLKNFHVQFAKKVISFSLLNLYNIWNTGEKEQSSKISEDVSNTQIFSIGGLSVIECATPKCSKSVRKDSKYCSNDCAKKYLQSVVNERFLRKFDPELDVQKIPPKSNSLTNDDRSKLQILYLRQEKLSIKIKNLKNSRAKLVDELEMIYDQRKLASISIENDKEKLNTPEFSPFNDGLEFCSICCSQMAPSKFLYHLKKCASKVFSR